MIGGCTLNNRPLAAATLFVFVTVFTLTFFPTDSADAARCGGLRTAANNAVKGVMFKRLCEFACRKGLRVFETANRICNTVLSF